MTTTKLLRKRKRLTNKAKVLRKWPNAELQYAYACNARRGGWCVWVLGKTSAYWRIEGHGRTPAAAWRDAARRL